MSARTDLVKCRHLQQANAQQATYAVELTLQKCGSSSGLSGATVNALLNGFTASNQTFPLTSSGNSYTGRPQ